MSININKASRNNGFVILYAVIVASTVLLIGLSLMNIITKQVLISTLSRGTKTSYSAAWSAEACYRYWAIHQRFNTSDDPPTEDISIVCGTDSVITIPRLDSMPSDRPGNIIPGYYIVGGFRYTVFKLDMDDKLCSTVYIKALDPVDEVTGGSLEAYIRGYNTSCDNLDEELGSANARLSQVELKITD